MYRHGAGGCATAASGVTTPVVAAIASGSGAMGPNREGAAARRHGCMSAVTSPATTAATPSQGTMPRGPGAACMPATAQPPAGAAAAAARCGFAWGCARRSRGAGGTGAPGAGACGAVRDRVGGTRDAGRVKCAVAVGAQWSAQTRAPNVATLATRARVRGAEAVGGAAARPLGAGQRERGTASGDIII